MTRKKMAVMGLAVGLTLCAVVTVAYAAGQQEEMKASFLVSYWSGDWLPTYLPKILLEDELGYSTELVNLSIPAGVTAIAAGEVSLTTIVWMPNNEPLMAKYLGNEIVDLGTIYSECVQGMFVPKWVSERYGVKSISDLDNPDFAKAVDIDGDGKGDWIGCDPGWLCAKLNDECIAVYGLERLYQQMMGQEHFLLAAFEGRMKKRQPVLISQFYPHTMFIDYPMNDAVVLLDDPKDFWITAHVQKYANKEWAAENPEAAELVRQVSITGEDVMWMMGQVRDKGDDPATIEELAREWIAENQTTVNRWLTVIK